MESDRLSVVGFFGATVVSCSKEKLKSLGACPAEDRSENDEDLFNLDPLLTLLLDCAFSGGLYVQDELESLGAHPTIFFSPSFW
jgi:hypothetical protein